MVLCAFLHLSCALAYSFGVLGEAPAVVKSEGGAASAVATVLGSRHSPPLSPLPCPLLLPLYPQQHCRYDRQPSEDGIAVLLLCLFWITASSQYLLVVIPVTSTSFYNKHTQHQQHLCRLLPPCVCSCDHRSRISNSNVA